MRGGRPERESDGVCDRHSTASSKRACRAKTCVPTRGNGLLCATGMWWRATSTSVALRNNEAVSETDTLIPVPLDRNAILIL